MKPAANVAPITNCTDVLSAIISLLSPPFLYTIPTVLPPIRPIPKAV
jgi:hypothetical protein